MDGSGGAVTGTSRGHGATLECALSEHVRDHSRSASLIFGTDDATRGPERDARCSRRPSHRRSAHSYSKLPSTTIDVTTVNGFRELAVFPSAIFVDCADYLVGGMGAIGDSMRPNSDRRVDVTAEELCWHEIISDLSGRSDRFDANADTSRFGVELDDNSGSLVMSKHRVVAMGRHIPPLARVGGVLRRIAQRPADVSTLSPVGVLSASAARRSAQAQPTDTCGDGSDA